MKEDIEQKAEGGTIIPAEPPGKPDEVIDLMAALEANLASAKDDRKPVTKVTPKKAAATKRSGGGARRKSV